MKETMTTAEICKLLGLEPETPPEKIREAVAVLSPGPVLDELSCRAVGIEPEIFPSIHVYPGIDGGEFGYTSDCECGAWMGASRSGAPDGIDPFGPCPKNPETMAYLPVSTDPAAAHRLAMTAIEWGPGCPVWWPFRDHFAGAVLLRSSRVEWDATIDSHRIELYSDHGPEFGTTPMHAAAIALALDSLERSQP